MEDFRHRTPKNILDLATLLALNLTATSCHPEDAVVRADPRVMAALRGEMPQ